MLRSSSFPLISDAIAPELPGFGRIDGCIPGSLGDLQGFWTQLLIQYQQFSAHHPQVGLGKQGVQLRGVLGQPPVAHLEMSELTLDDPKRVLYLGPDARLDGFQLIDELLAGPCLVQRFALAWPHGHVPEHILGLRPFMSTLVACVGKHIAFLPVQQSVGDHHVMDVGRCGLYRVHQARFGIHPNVGLHAKVPLVALLRLMHLGVTLPRGVLGGAWSTDQRGIDHGSGLEQQALGCELIVDHRQKAWGQLVLLQQMSKPQDGALVGQPLIPAELGKLTKQRYVVQRLFHRRVAQREPLLHKVNAQHRVDRKRRAAGPAHWRMRLNLLDQRLPRHHPIHLGQKLPLARSLGAQVQSKFSLLHTFHPQHPHLIAQAGLRGGFAEVP